MKLDRGVAKYRNGDIINIHCITENKIPCVTINHF